MRIEVDQSGKIELTQKPTAVAFSNHKSKSLFILAKSKRTILSALKQAFPNRDPATNKFLVFATLVFLLLKSHLQEIDQIVLDVEYQGHSPTIKEHFLNLCRKHKIAISPNSISFAHIGKHSPAHDLAISVFRLECDPNLKVASNQVLKEFGLLPTKK